MGKERHWKKRKWKEWIARNGESKEENCAQEYDCMKLKKAEYLIIHSFMNLTKFQTEGKNESFTLSLAFTNTNSILIAGEL